MNERASSGLRVVEVSPQQGEPDLGQQIRSLRMARGFAIKELAARAQLSAGAISQLERGIGSPSIKSLRNISRALGVPIAYFFDKETSEDRPSSRIVTRSKNRKKMKFGDIGMEKEILSSTTSNDLELLLVRLDPGGSSGPEIYSHEGEEGGLVIAGTLDLWVDGEQFTLQAGDSFGFNSALPHKFSNSSSSEVQVIWVNTPPLYRVS